MKKTPNVQQGTANAELIALPLVAGELATADYGAAKRRPFDLEDRLLEFAVKIIDVTDELRVRAAEKNKT